MTAVPPLRTRTVEVDGARMRLAEAGEGRPLLFLHGWGMTGTAYAQGLARLAAGGVRVLAPDLPGFGGSDALPLRGLDLPSFAARLGRLLDVLDLPGRIDVAGHSFGGGVALHLAAQRFERLRGLALLSPVGGARGGRRGAVAGWLRCATGSVAQLDTTEAVRCGASVLSGSVAGALRRPAAYAVTGHLAVRAVLDDVAATLVAAGLPVLFVWARDDRVMRRGTFGADLPSRVVPGGHGWPLTAPGDLAAVLTDALRRSDAPAAGPDRAAATPGGGLAGLIPPQRRPAQAAPRTARPL